MAGRRVNVNVGVLGHIDSGKTALARALSTTASTAAFDKQPQSRERGITLDLGFSCFAVPLPGADEPLLQVTLVDCPGHASLIRTIIGGSRVHPFCLWQPSLGDQRPLTPKLHRASQMQPLSSFLH
uniref:Tr-type G domain-containing protein n=1 Tax=Castor canadensis TaxID=51338 RepID=A0A8C0XYT7_CASCN